MALRGQPYLPLYVQDFLCDERLAECSAESTGVYIRLMCLMHKSETYGAILLKQKDKQSEDKICNFVSKLVRQMPFTAEVIERSLIELLDENVIRIDGDMLYQKRMVKDGKLSDIRSSARRGKGKNQARNNFVDGFDADFVGTKTASNSENENEIENEDEDVKEEVGNTEESSHAQECVASLILNDGTYFNVSAKDYNKWVTLYPAVDVMQELRNMVGWCDANRKKRKTRSGIRRFINNWLAGEQDKGGSMRHKPQSSMQRPSAGGTALGTIQQLHQKYSGEGSG